MKFWKWVRNEADPELEPEIQEARTLFLNGTIAEEPGLMTRFPLNSSRMS